jgi:hypothetical protein
MSAILTDVDSWVIALVLALAMFTAWGLGLHVGQRAAQASRDAPGGKLNDAIVALLGLLLAFTFSMSLGKAAPTTGFFPGHQPPATTR